VSIVQQPELVVTRPRPDRLCFVTPPNRQTWATESLLVNVHTDGRFVVLTGCFHAYATGDESKTERRMGPFSSEANASSACAAIAAAIRLPRVPRRVTEQELRAEPARFDKAHVEVTGTWTYGFESCSFVGASFVPPSEKSWPSSVISKRITARGFWSFAPESFGNRGAYDAQLCAYEMFDVPGKTFKIGSSDISFEQNGDRDEWRVCVNGSPVMMASQGNVVEWLPIGPCLRSPEPFEVRKQQAKCLWSGGHADVQGTIVYLMEEVALTLSVDRKTVVVTIRDASDTSA